MNETALAVSVVIMMGVIVIIAILWTKGIDKAMKDYPDYDGDDLFGYHDEFKKTKNKKQE